MGVSHAGHDDDQEQRRPGICLTLSNVGMGSRLNSLLTQQTSIKKVLLQQAVMQTLALQSRLMAPDSAKPFCFYTA